MSVASHYQSGLWVDPAGAIRLNKRFLRSGHRQCRE
jgi:hypothetical protein